MKMFNQTNYSLPKAGQSFPELLMGLPLIQSVMNDVERSTQAPRSLIFTAVAASISLCVQGLVDVKKPSGGLSPCSLMTLTIALSGLRKSTVEKIISKSIRDVQASQDVEYEARLIRWRVKHNLWSIRKRGVEKKLERLASEGDVDYDLEGRYGEILLEEPKRPRRFKMLYEDSSSEALFRGMYIDYPSAGIISSEGGGALKGAALKDFSKQNALWSGDGVFVDRISRDGFTLNNARLTVSLMVQPGVFENYMKARGELSLSSGFFARFLVCSPNSNQGSRRIEIDESFASSHALEEFHKRLSYFVDLNVSRLVAEDSSRAALRFEESAKVEWVLFSRFVEANSAAGGYWESMRDHASKLADNVARLAAIFYCLEEGRCDGEISRVYLDAAIQVGLWYSGEYAKIFSRSGRLERDAKILAGWMFEKAYANGTTFTKGQLQRCGPNKLRQKADLDEVLSYLEASGLVRIEYHGRSELIVLSPHGRIRDIGILDMSGRE
ncbi:YfjI family protein [Pseudomonas aeruginosa]|uniref:YfjI family protein n=1 Tax=Pseudomonas aeruginosa TaxID=287 RepID=UPI0007A89333|nr:YfjI family protein [Pseudomonas aeruginosa]AYZ85428.1 DUF3987 domain-containing protein [Pseudomonas aeruginosa]KYO94241.1 hypothetical protein LT19_00104 [Pseudomonas aeruginosa]RTS42967.1 DUF3987 domain-containing protein [Pseudomonas aeruginosa]HCG0227505.1 DUF3987 domain-containing protein [Pseudomonas aeruginosa]